MVKRTQYSVAQDALILELAAEHEPRHRLHIWETKILPVFLETYPEPPRTARGLCERWRLLTQKKPEPRPKRSTTRRRKPSRKTATANELSALAQQELLKVRAKMKEDRRLEAALVVIASARRH